MIRSLAWLVALSLTLTSAPIAVRAGAPSANLPDLLQTLLPAVVNISSDRVGDPNGTAAARKRESLGSGFIIDPSGIVLTNQHVIEGAYEITVTLQDHTALKAKLIAGNKVGDVAVLKVNAGKPLPVVKIGDSDALRVGQPVIAIGNPAGLGGSVSSGIVSALNRDISASPYDDYVQTDAAINHGSSGGPLFDLSGEVIAMNTAIFTPGTNGGSIGLGFSIPINDVVFVVGQLRQFGRVRPGTLNADLQPVTPDIATALGLPDVNGAIVTKVSTASMAAESGLQDGDVIRAIRGRAVTDPRSVRRGVAVAPLGSLIAVDIWRERKPMTLQVRVAEYDDTNESVTGTGAMAMGVHVDRADLGLKLAPLTDYARGQYGLARDQKGVLVTSVVPFSAAEDRGIVAGDVLVRMQQTDIVTPDDVMRRFDDLRGKERTVALVLVQGREGLRWVSLPIPPQVAAQGQ